MQNSLKSKPMYLSVVERSGDLKGTDIRALCIERLNLRTDDIEGAQPRRVTHTNKSSFFHCKDVDGAQPVELYPRVNRPTDLSLNVKDIDGATPHRVEFRTRRCINPVDPQYQLPSCSPCPPVIVPFSGRETNKLDDIEGSSPQKLIRDRETPVLPPVEGSNPKAQKTRSTSNSLDVSDINRAANRVCRPRDTSPLDPEYIYPSGNATSLKLGADSHTDQNSQSTIGFIPGTKPRTLHRERDWSSSNIHVRDIPGAAPQRFVGTMPFNIRMSYEEREPNDLGKPRDIEGAKHGTVLRGLASARLVNPLDPEYILPGARP